MSILRVLMRDAFNRKIKLRLAWRWMENGRNDASGLPIILVLVSTLDCILWFTCAYETVFCSSREPIRLYFVVHVSLLNCIL